MFDHEVGGGMSSFLAGLASGLSFIVAIGAQNAFVLRQGLRQEHVFWVCLVCALSDALLIAVGVAGVGALSEAAPWFRPVMIYGGAAFLIVYGAKSFLNAWRGAGHLDAAKAEKAPLWPVLATVLTLTWLNPHVYLDTVVLLGAVSSQYPDRLAFAIGAMAASFGFFFSLGYAARFVAPILSSARAWRILEIVIGATMWAIAWKLLRL